MPRRKTQEEFLHDACAIFPEYDFSMSVYNGAYKPIIYKCPIHGIQKTEPRYLLAGRGCKECHENRYFTRNPLPIELLKIKEENKQKFIIDYSNYNGSMSMLKLVCKKCGNESKRLVCNLVSKVNDCPWCIKKI